MNFTVLYFLIYDFFGGNFFYCFIYKKVIHISQVRLNRSDDATEFH